jgi:hypothetical protein
MIGGPSDVEEERSVIRAVTADWNAVHAQDRAAVLLPTSWDTDAAPSMAGSAQEVINRQVLKHADILVAVFWTRIGTPTGASQSGTVEEIERHVADKKLAMLYFSDVPLPPSRVDHGQYQALREFRSSCERRGLLETYRTMAEFREKFSRQLAHNVRDLIGASASAPREAPIGDPPRTRHVTISDTAKEVLCAMAAADGGGRVLIFSVNVGDAIQTEGRMLNDPNSHRDTARWRAALDELAGFGLIQQTRYDPVTYELQESGYTAADQICGQAKAAE